MNERLIVKSFGPVKDIDITFRKVTLFIGDQGTGKSCIAKLFSMFKWLEKALMTEKYSLNYFEKYIDARFKKQLCSYHRIEYFFNEDSYILYQNNLYRFEYKNEAFSVKKTGNEFDGLPKIMYVPAERIILSSAEKKLKTFDGLPASNQTFNQAFWEAKESFKDGYELPFGNLRYKYDALRDKSWIIGNKYHVNLINASSGIQSALPVCITSEYLAGIVASGKDRPMSVKEIQRLQKETSKIMDNTKLSDTVKEAMLSHLSGLSRYNSFVNIVEEPELSLFPKSQNEIIRLLCKVNNEMGSNMLVLTSHSPYTLAILNTLTLAAKVYERGNDEIRKEVDAIIPQKYHIKPNELTAVRLSADSEEPYSKSIISTTSGMIAKNDLDSASDDIMREFNNLYRLYAQVIK